MLKPRGTVIAKEEDDKKKPHAENVTTTIRGTARQSRRIFRIYLRIFPAFRAPANFFSSRRDFEIRLNNQRETGKCFARWSSVPAGLPGEYSHDPVSKKFFVCRRNVFMIYGSFIPEAEAASYR